MSSSMNLIFKIVSSTEWRAAEAGGVFAGAAVDRADGYIHFSTAAQAPETAQKWFAGRDDLMLVAVDADALGARAALGALARRRTVSASLWRVAADGRRLVAAFAARGRRTAQVRILCRNDRRPRRARSPLAFAAAAGKRASGGDRGVEVRASLADRRRADRRLAVDAFGLAVSASARAGGGIRQERRGSGRAARARLRLRRSGNLDAAPADAATPSRDCSACPPTAPSINRMGFNNDGFEAARARLTARASSGIVGVNFGPNKDASDRIADYVAGREDFRRRRELFHDQCFLAEHGGPARSAAPRRARRTRRPRDRGARGGLARAGRC